MNRYIEKQLNDYRIVLEDCMYEQDVIEQKVQEYQQALEDDARLTVEERLVDSDLRHYGFSLIKYVDYSQDRENLYPTYYWIDNGTDELIGGLDFHLEDVVEFIEDIEARIDQVRDCRICGEFRKVKWS